MRFQKKNLIIIIALLILVIGFFLTNTKSSEIDKTKIYSSSIIAYPSQYNYRQTINDCGPFNAAAVVRALIINVDSKEFAKNIGWRLPNKYTLPQGMEQQLKKNDVAIEIPNLKKLSDENKIDFLREQLSQKKPIIILGGRENYQHYITIFGFDRSKNEFYIYDSLFDKGVDGLTKDSNGDLPGNRTYSSDELLNFWRRGGMYGFYTWYAIIASK